MSENKKPWVSRHKVLTGIGIFIVLAIVVSAASGGSKSEMTNTDNKSNISESAVKETEKTAKLNEAAKDGKFEFTVVSVDCGKSTVGTNQYLQKTAQGQYCLMNVTIKNVGDQAQTFDSSQVSLFDSAGSKFSADSLASNYANPDSNTFLNQINPGNNVNAIVVFDVPKGTTPISAELHDSIFSSGVKVNLQ